MTIDLMPNGLPQDCGAPQVYTFVAHPNGQYVRTIKTLRTGSDAALTPDEDMLLALQTEIVFARAIIAAHEAQRQAPAQPAALFGGPRLTPFGTREFWGTLLDGVKLRADTPLYTSPQPVTKPMTQIEINAMIDNFPAHSWDTDELIVRAVERHHGIGKA